LNNSVAARRSDVLRMRLQSAAILVPVALAAVWFGPPWITIVVGLAGLAMAWEWGRLSGGARPFGPRGAIVTIAVAVAIVAAAVDRFPLALTLAAAGAVAAALAQRTERGWTAIGTLWIAAGCVSFLSIAAPAHGGRNLTLLLLGVVWATDIFSYFVGKAIGGPRLAPDLSPNKTWAGFVGGLAGGVAAGIVVAFWAGAPPGNIAAFSLVLGLFTQAGDLAESWAKRHFAVKDTSGLIPGHGGVLDRLDGLLAASIAAAMLTFILGDATVGVG
jgi:phosphatidate cytidylyltransferase